MAINSIPVFFLMVLSLTANRCSQMAENENNEFRGLKPINEAPCAEIDSSRARIDDGNYYSSFCESSLNEYSIKVKKQCVNDSISEYERHLFYPVCISQYAYICKNDSIVSEIKFPWKKIRQKNTKGVLISMSNLVITEIGVFLTEANNPVFYILAYGGCNSCNEYQGFYDINGKLLYSILSGGRNKPKEAGDSKYLQISTESAFLNNKVKNYCGVCNQ